MSKKAVPVLIAILVIGTIIGSVILITKSRKIPDNPPETLGNSSGNLNNGGYFCEHDGTIYFSNFQDNHYLYKMNSDGSDAVMMLDVPVSYINAAGDYIYYYYDDQGEAKFMGVSGNMRGIYRLAKDGKSDMSCLERSTSGIISLIGNKIYYEHYDNTDGMTLYYTSLDGKDKGQAVKSIINPACVIYGDIYYPDQDNMFKLCKYTPGASAGSEYSDIQMYNPTVVGDFIYYIDIEHNYGLSRYNTLDGSVTRITKERIDTFNVYNDSIFYQRNSDPALIHVNADGSNPVIIAEGNYSNINCTSMWTFFSAFNDNSQVYMIPTNGIGAAMNFEP